jgi:DNA-binding LacI/PurR family transcriptional regulator
MTKLKDVAEKASVSLATASLALSDSTLISIKTKQKVKKWAEKLDYYPNIYAQRLARRKNYNVCLMLNSKFFFKSSNIHKNLLLDPPYINNIFSEVFA